MQHLQNIILLSLCSLCLHADEISITSLDALMTKYSDIEYVKCHDSEPFDYGPFPLLVEEQFQPDSGMFAETFVLRIEQGKVCSKLGFVQVGQSIIQELLPQNYATTTFANLLQSTTLHERHPNKVAGKVVVLTRIDHECYCHWIEEIIGRLALLQMHNIEYDWLYVPYDKPYIKQTLQLLGVDPKKVIEPYDDMFYIQADELIVPSLTVRRVPTDDDQNFSNYNPLSTYCAQWNRQFVRDQFLAKADDVVAKDSFCKRVFVSRKNAKQRRMLNEDEVFALFEQKGFKRYFLEEMSFLEQVQLFHQAEIIVGAHGAGLTNVLFCNDEARIIEIFQNRFDSNIWHLSQLAGLQYDCIKTQKEDWSQYSQVDTQVSINIIEQFIEQNL